ncbi:MAG: DUF1080 domain-containing protein [Flavobacteriaceae bacterium]
MKTKHFFITMTVVFLACTSLKKAPTNSSENTNWESLLDKDLSKWDIFMGVPHYSVDLEGYEKGNGMKGTPIGLGKDPLNVFSVKEIDGEQVLHITGEIYAGLSTKSAFENYHFSTEFKWGTKQWEPRLEDKRDSGILYHCQEPHGQFWNVWMKAPEMQVQEGDCGDFHPLAGVAMDIRASKVEENGKELWAYDPNGAIRTFKSGPGGRCKKSVNYEKPNDQWNLLELICIGDKAYHIVNGKVVMVLENSVQFDKEGNPSSLTKGKIQLQSEAAEVFYRNLKIAKVDKLPKAFAKQLK